MCIVLFVLSWLPFFTVNELVAFCMKLSRASVFCEAASTPLLYKLVVWIGYSNSAVNPVTYAVANAEFRRAFMKLLHVERSGQGIAAMLSAQGAQGRPRRPTARV